VALRSEIAAGLPRRGRARLTVVRPGGLGDTLLTVPTLQLMLRHVPRAALTLVGSAWAEQIGPLLTFPVRVLRFDSPLLTPLFRADAGAEPTGAFSAAHAVVIYSSGADEALVRNVRRLCSGSVTTWPVRPPGREHAAVHFARAVADPVPRPLPFAELRVPQQEIEWSGQWFGRRMAGRGGAIAIHPGSGGRRKCWPPERFARLAEALDRPILLIEGPADEEVCREVAERVPSRLLLGTAAGLRLSRAAALMARCTCYVGNDSGISHLAAGLGVPTVAVFGPTHPAVWGPHGPTVCVVGPQAAGEGWPSVGDVAGAVAALSR